MDFVDSYKGRPIAVLIRDCNYILGAYESHTDPDALIIEMMPISLLGAATWTEDCPYTVSLVEKMSKIKEGEFKFSLHCYPKCKIARINV